MQAAVRMQITGFLLNVDRTAARQLKDAYEDASHSRPYKLPCRQIEDGDSWSFLPDWNDLPNRQLKESSRILCMP